MARRKKVLVEGAVERFVRQQLTKNDEAIILEMLEERELLVSGGVDRQGITEVHDVYRFFGICRSVYDGDTITVLLDQGFGQVDEAAKIRLWGVNTAEIRKGTERQKKRGRETRDFVRERVLGRGVLLVSHKMKHTVAGSWKPGTGRYGRYLCEVLYLDGDGKLTNLNKELVDTGRSKINTYGAPFNGWSE